MQPPQFTPTLEVAVYVLSVFCSAPVYTCFQPYPSNAELWCSQSFGKHRLHIGTSDVKVTCADAASSMLAAVEQVYVSRGSRIQAGSINEDSTLYLRNMSEGQTVTIPQGLL